MELLFVLNKVHCNAMYKGKSPAQSRFVEEEEKLSSEYVFGCELFSLVH